MHRHIDALQGTKRSAGRSSGKLVAAALLLLTAQAPSPTATRIYLARGALLMAHHEVAAARRELGIPAQAGDGAAAYGMAQTYDLAWLLGHEADTALADAPLMTAWYHFASEHWSASTATR